MDPAFLIALIGAISVPLTGLLTGLLVDRRNKQAAAHAAKVAEEQSGFTKQELEITAKEAANHEFAAITTGFTEYTEKLERRNAGLETRVAALEEQNQKLEQRIRSMERRHQLAMEHLFAVEQIAPADKLPRRPRGL